MLVGPTHTVTPAWPAPSTIVWVPVLLIYRHRGVVSDRYFEGAPMVISNSARAGGVVEGPWHVFAAGADPRVERQVSALPAWEIVRRARSMVGTRYRLLDWNCDSLVDHALGLAPGSEQVAATVVTALGIGFLIAGRKS